MSNQHAAPRGAVVWAMPTVFLLALLAAACGGGSGNIGMAVLTLGLYQGSAAAGDFVKVRLDPLAATYRYENLTTGHLEEGTFTTEAGGWKRFTPTAGTTTSKIRQAFEVPDIGLAMIADSTGKTADKTSLVFAVPEAPITVADISSGAAADVYNYLQFRTRDGGFEFGQFQIQGTTMTGSFYIPYENAVGGSAANKAIDFGGAQVSSDGKSLGVPVIEFGVTFYLTFFKTATSGLLVVDNPNGGIFQVKASATKDFNASRAGTYAFLSYGSSGTVNGAEATGTVVTGTMTIAVDGKVSVAGDPNMQNLALTPMADAKNSLLRVNAGVYTADNLGAFYTRSPDGGRTRETFVVFVDGAVFFSSVTITGEDTNSMLNGRPRPTTYTYSYGTGLKTGTP